MFRKKIPILIFLICLVFSCNPYSEPTEIQLLILSLQEMNGHGHAVSGRGYNYGTGNVGLLVDFIKPFDERGKTYEIASPPVVPDGADQPSEDAEKVRPQSVAKADAYFDHVLDGVRLGLLTVWAEGATSALIIPLIVSINATNKNTAYASVAFLDLAQTILDRKTVWRAGYTGAIKITPRSYASAFDLSFTFNVKMADGIVRIAEAAKNLKVTMAGYYTTQDYFSFETATSKGYDPEFSVSLDLWSRMTQTQGMEGLWIGGFVDSVYAGKELGDIYHPIVLMMRTLTAYGANHMSLMTYSRPINEFKISGKKLWAAEWRDYGYAFDMEREGADKLTGKFLYRIYPPTADYEYTLCRMGYGGKKMKLVRTVPAAAALRNTKNQPKLTIIGDGFAPGAMIHFSDPHIKVKDIQYVNQKQLKVTIQALDPIKKGRAIGVRVVNPDNSRVTKGGLFRTK